MYLYPYKIFALSKNKRVLKSFTDQQPVGIYDADKMSYSTACSYADRDEGIKVSVLLGTVVGKTRLLCLDLDDCFEKDGHIEPQTKKFLEEFDLDEYEVSSSGEGIHVYILTNMELETFIVKDLEGCKSFECYTNKRHIVTTTFDFENTNLIVGKHDKFLKELYDRVMDSKARSNKQIEAVKAIFNGEEYMTEQEFNGKIYKRTPVTDMYTLRGLGYKDPQLIECIDASPDSVDQSAHDAKLIRKLMYYTLSFDSAREMAKKTNYYKAKDARHKKKFDDPVYIERTRRFLMR